jgi:hypothetical protein
MKANPSEYHRSNDISELKEAKHKLYVTPTETSFMRKTIEIFHKGNNSVCFRTLFHTSLQNGL